MDHAPEPATPSHPHFANTIAAVIGVTLIVVAIAIVTLALRPPSQPANLINGALATSELRAFDGDYTAAIAHFSVPAAAAPDDPYAQYMLGRAYFAAGDYTSALSRFQQALRLNSNDAEVLYYVTRTRNRLNDKRTIKADLERVLQLDPAHAEAHHFLAGVLIQENQLDQAWIHANEAVRLAPNNDRIYNNRGILYYHRREYRRAIADLTRSLQDSDQIESPTYWRGRAYRDLGDFQAAVADLERSVQADPSFLRARLELAYAYSNVGNLHRAEATLDEVLALNDRFNDARYERALVRFEQANYQGAIEDAEILLSQGWEQDFRPWATRGVSRYYLGDVAGAFDDYSQSIARQPSPQILNNRGQMFFDRAQYVEARKDFDQAIALAPEFPPAYRNRAVTLDRLGDRPAALADLRRAEELYLRIGDEHNLREVRQVIQNLSATP